MRQYALVTHWHLAAPIDRVWDAIFAVEDWARWWRYVQAVIELKRGDAKDVGAVRRFTWSSALPYRLSFEMGVTAVERLTSMEGIASGELSGCGRWHLETDGATTRMRYNWTMATTPPWMNFAVPVMQSPVSVESRPRDGRRWPRSGPPPRCRASERALRNPKNRTRAARFRGENRRPSRCGAAIRATVIG